MDTKTLIQAEDFCQGHALEFSYLHTLRDHGLIEVVEIEKRVFIRPEELPKLEKIVRFNRELEINLEGVEVILHLLDRVQSLQNERIELLNKLR